MSDEPWKFFGYTNALELHLSCTNPSIYNLLEVALEPVAKRDLTGLALE